MHPGASSISSSSTTSSFSNILSFVLPSCFTSSSLHLDSRHPFSSIFLLYAFCTSSSSVHFLSTLPPPSVIPYYSCPSTPWRRPPHSTVFCLHYPPRVSHPSSSYSFSFCLPPSSSSAALRRRASTAWAKNEAVAGYFYITTKRTKF